MNSLTITKTGRIELEEYIYVRGISLKSVALYFNSYNLATPTVYVKDRQTTNIPAGYYTFEKLKELIPDLSFDYNTLKVTYSGTLTGGLKKLIDEQSFIYLTPLSLYVYVERIDGSRNYLNGKRSKLLSIIPVGKTNIGEIFEYQPFNNFKKLYEGNINSLNISIKDEWGNDYKGKFVAEFTLE